MILIVHIDLWACIALLYITMPCYWEIIILGGHFMDMIIIQVWATILWDIVVFVIFVTENDMEWMVQK